MIEKLKKYESVTGFKYPDSYLKIVELNLIDFDHWSLLSFDQLSRRRESLIKRYPKRNVIPFARRFDNDDVACFEMGYGERVFVVHDFSSEGYERRQEFDDFWSWFISAINELIEGD